MADALHQNGATAAFRQHLPDLNTPRFQIAKEQTPYAYTEAFQKNKFPPWIFNLTEMWKELLEEPLQGLSTDGTIRPDLFKAEDCHLPMPEIMAKTQQLLDVATDEQRSKMQYPINASEWRCWSNPEFLLRPFGVRLEEEGEQFAKSVLRIIEATFSPEGYNKALAAMRTNHFLGECCGLLNIMNEFSYNFLIFGTPSETVPWGWSLYGHHLCLTAFFKSGHIVISPTFTAAEPNMIDAGPYAGTEILRKEGELGLQLMQSLSDDLKKRARIFVNLRDPEMKQDGDLKTDYWNQDDQRHQCGAFRDNRVLPYAGVSAKEFTSEQKQTILDIANEMTLYLPETARKQRLAQIQHYFDETFFAWIGGYGDDDPFYFRVHSPVVILEFDHHSGVFLSNKEPAKFHIHTIVRTPNAGDYGQALRDHNERIP